MSDNNFSDPADDVPHTYPEDTLDATLSLQGHLIKLFQQNGPLRFDHFMQECLYHPLWGYYSTGDSRVGKAGDFFTSVSVGACFGMLLAHRIITYFREQQLGFLQIIEMGANTGQLAADILDIIQKDAPDIYSNTHYTIIEPLPPMVQHQRKTLQRHQEIIQHFPSLQDLSTKPIQHGIFLSNELIDAFPCRIIIRKNHQWLERLVCLDENLQWQWIDAPIHPHDPLHHSIQTLPSDLPEGYLTEIRIDLPTFVYECAAAMLEGLIITIDYGYTRSHYYSPHRTTGTLRTFYCHQAGEDPLINLGDQDITAHVDFTTLASAFIKSGYEPQYFDHQARYLTQHAATWMQQVMDSESPPSAKLTSQFQTLTHPSMMGSKFLVLECQKPAKSVPSVLTRLDIPV